MSEVFGKSPIPTEPPNGLMAKLFAAPLSEACISFASMRSFAPVLAPVLSCKRIPPPLLAPSMSPTPVTVNLLLGEGVAIPTRPEESMCSLSLLFVQSSSCPSPSWRIPVSLSPRAMDLPLLKVLLPGRTFTPKLLPKRTPPAYSPAWFIYK